MTIVKYEMRCNAFKQFYSVYWDTRGISILLESNFLNIPVFGELEILGTIRICRVRFDFL